MQSAVAILGAGVSRAVSAHLPLENELGELAYGSSVPEAGSTGRISWGRAAGSASRGSGPPRTSSRTSLRTMAFISPGVSAMRRSTLGSSGQAMDD